MEAGVIKRRIASLLVGAALVLGLLAVACSSGSSPSGTSVAGQSAAATPAPVGLEIATDDKFSVTRMAATAGVPQTLTLTNKGQATHNWHLLDARGATGEQIKTDLEDAGATKRVTFTVTQPGTYHFQCDVHPDDMKGTLVVTP